MNPLETQATIDQRAAELVENFAFFDDWMGRYEYLIELGQSLPLIEDEYKSDAFKIKGCQSQVWVRAEAREGLVYYKGDSDAMITKGLVALLVHVLSGQPPEAVAAAPLDFLDDIGLKEHLSPTRKNGLAGMVKQMKRFALALSGVAQNGATTSN